MIDPAFWRGRRVLVTGHTGFKGTWLSLWLAELGASVDGLARSRGGEGSLHARTRAGERITQHTVDLRDEEAVRAAVAAARPEVVLHLGGQPIISRSFTHPEETFEANVLGTAHLLDAVAATGGVRAVVVVSSQQVYEPGADDGRPHREDDPLGGADPYSASRACTELLTAAMRRSLLEPAGVGVATARAANVIGGGDLGEARLVPGVMRAALSGGTVELRSPGAQRPWQHVLDALGGYLVIAERIAEDPSLGGAYNLGPPAASVRPVGEVVERLSALWGRPLATVPRDAARASAPDAVRLDTARARERLGWQPAWDLDAALEAVVGWYRAVDEGEDPRDVCVAQIAAYGRTPTLLRP